jgi:carotenoid cleavage dioxygenase-like enzyme
MLLTISGIFLLLSSSFGDNAGWRSYMIENTAEFHDVPLTWEWNDKAMPSWLKGTYIRNGPAQISFGSPRRILGSWLDGFAKLHSFKMDGDKVLFSGKMLEPPNYLDSVAKGELVPMLTLNKFANDDDEWTTMEKLEIVNKVLFGDPFGNNNPAVWRIGPKEDGIYLAVTDSTNPTRFNISDLSTLGNIFPASYPITMSGCTHYLREPGTDNSINVQTKKGFTGAPWIEVQRYRPSDTYQTPEVVATFTPTKLSYIHSFSVTENYAVFFFYAVSVDATQMWDANFHVFETLVGGNTSESTDIYVVNLKNGKVQGPFLTHYTFSVHHANAYEKNENELVVDLSPSPFENFKEYPNMDNMLNPAEVDDRNDTSTCADKEFTRYTINMASGNVGVTEFPNTLGSRYINKFDFPTINEDYRGKKYCIMYGVSAFSYSRTALVKKNVCDSSKDKVLYLENHYTTEMSFVPNPAGDKEDDGALVTIVFDGDKEQSYFYVIDAATFTPINKAYLPHNIPWSAHGLHFPEAQF